MSASQSHARAWAIVPAAGLGRRMGKPKQALAFQGSTIVAAVVRTLLDADFDGVVVVTRTELMGRLRLPAEARVHVCINDDADSEMIDSVRVGLGALSRLQAEEHDAVAVIPADMPMLTGRTCRACVAAYHASPQKIIIATHRGRRGHPIVFPFSMRRDIAGLHGGLRDLPRLLPERVQLVDVEDAGTQIDLDTPQDYRRLTTNE